MPFNPANHGSTGTSPVVAWDKLGYISRAEPWPHRDKARWWPGTCPATFLEQNHRSTGTRPGGGGHATE